MDSFGHKNGTMLRLVRGDITEARVDAVVNAANETLLAGGGVDGAIHRRGGPAIRDACETIREKQYPNGLPTGEAVVTVAGHLPAARVIHAVGPVWRGGGHDERKLLRRAYRSALEQALAHGLRTVAFPSLSTGAYGFPVQEASTIALSTVGAFIHANPDAFDEIQFVLFTDADFNAFARALDTVELPGPSDDAHA
jgi:O-acetyl-ADP-ribose deacetylase